LRGTLWGNLPGPFKKKIEMGGRERKFVCAEKAPHRVANKEPAPDLNFDMFVRSMIGQLTAFGDK
jgi:hypothetical protein